MRNSNTTFFLPADVTALKMKCQNKVPITEKIQRTQQIGAVFFFFFKSQLFLKSIKGQPHCHVLASEPNREIFTGYHTR